MNNNWKTWLIAFSVGLNAVLIGGWLSDRKSDPAPEKREERPGRFFEVSAEDLNLPPAELEKWESLQRDQDSRMIRMKKEAMERMERLDSLLTREDLTEQSLEQFLDELKQGTVGYAAGTLQSYLEQRALLNPQQRELLKEKMRERIERMREWTRERYGRFHDHLVKKYGEDFVAEALSEEAPIPLEESNE